MSQIYNLPLATLEDVLYINYTQFNITIKFSVLFSLYVFSPLYYVHFWKSCQIFFRTEQDINVINSILKII